MIDFWLVAGLLLLIAMGLLLIPVLRDYRTQHQDDCTALNVILYQERIAALQAQQAEGILNAAQLDTSRIEAVRELLVNTEGMANSGELRLGKPPLLLATVFVPVLSLSLYLGFGASDQVKLTRKLSQPQFSMHEIIHSLEHAVVVKPDLLENLYSLGRAYMAQDLSAEAAKIFQCMVVLAGRRPELLAQWAQALYFADNKQWSPKVQALTDEVLKLNPKEVISLSLLGVAAFKDQRYQEAIDYWNRLLVQFPLEDNYRVALQVCIDRATKKLQGKQ